MTKQYHAVLDTIVMLPFEQMQDFCLAVASRLETNDALVFADNLKDRLNELLNAAIRAEMAKPDHHTEQ